MKNMNKIDTSLYRDPNTGRWLQRGGPCMGSPDEIDTSVAGESSVDRAIRRNALTETLVPMDLLIQMPDPELRALELLLDVLTSPGPCRASSEGGGRILCRLDQDVDVEILVEYMIRVRLGLPWYGTEEENFPPRHDTHVICYMHLTDSESRWEGIEVCLQSTHSLDLAFPRSGIPLTIRDPITGLWAPDPDSLLPVIDSIVSWVIWAQCGFPDPPESFTDSYVQLTEAPLELDCTGEPVLPAYMTDEYGMEPFSELEWQARLWEESLMSSTRARRNPSRTCNVSVGSG